MKRHRQFFSIKEKSRFIQVMITYRVLIVIKITMNMQVIKITMNMEMIRIGGSVEKTHGEMKISIFFLLRKMMGTCFEFTLLGL